MNLNNLLRFSPDGPFSVIILKWFGYEEMCRSSQTLEVHFFKRMNYMLLTGAGHLLKRIAKEDSGYVVID